MQFPSIISQPVFNVNDAAEARKKHAIELSNYGFHLLPLEERGKRPHFDLLPKIAGEPNRDYYFYYKADQAEIERWFKEEPFVNIGIICGAGQGEHLYILDVDDPSKAPADLPGTVTVTTNRGSHYYFWSEKDITPQKYEYGELQGVGAYCVAAFSVHESGRIYNYEPNIYFMEPAPLPARYIKKPDTHEPTRIKPKPGNPAGDTSRKPLLKTNIKKEYEKDISSLYSFLSWSDIDEAAKRPEVAFEIMRLCGVEVSRMGKAFRCPLPGHDERKPSAALYQKDKDSYIGVNDFHIRERDANNNGYVHWPLVEVYHAVKTGQARKLGRGEKALWWLRALDEAGLLKTAAIKAPKLPKDAPKPAQRVFEGFKYLLRLRQRYDAEQEGAPFSYRFAAEWCGYKGTRQTQEAVTWLIQNGYIKRISGGKDAKSKLSIYALHQPGTVEKKPEKQKKEHRPLEKPPEDNRPDPDAFIDEVMGIFQGARIIDDRQPQQTPGAPERILIFEGSS